MIAVYCPEERQVGRLHAALAGVPMERTTSWPQFGEVVGGSACAVIMVDWLEGNPVLHRLGALRARYPQKPVVLVTRKDADNLRFLLGVEIEEVVWTEEMEHALASVVERAQESKEFRDIVSQLERAERLPPRLRRGLGFLFRSGNAIPTVEELANMVGCDRRTLWRMWVATVPKEAGLRLQDLLDWNVLIRAVLLRSQAQSWMGIARTLSVHEHTLARSARRLLGMSLRQAAEAGPARVIEIFNERVLSVLLDDGAVRVA